MFLLKYFSAIIFALTLSISVKAASIRELHTVSFVNNCGHGTPTLVQAGKILSSGQPYTSNGPLLSAIAYLQIGTCLLNGEGCTLIEMTLVNPTSPGSGSSADISLIPPHAFSVASGFEFTGGCNGAGKTCACPSCNSAFTEPDQTTDQVACQTNNANLEISFC